MKNIKIQLRKDVDDKYTLFMLKDRVSFFLGSISKIAEKGASIKLKFSKHWILTNIHSTTFFAKLLVKCE